MKRIYIWGGHTWAANGAVLLVMSRGSSLADEAGLLAGVCAVLAVYLWNRGAQM